MNPCVVLIVHNYCKIIYKPFNELFCTRHDVFAENYIKIWMFSLDIIKMSKKK